MAKIRSVSTPVAHLVGPGKLKVVNGHLGFSAQGQSDVRLDPKALTSVLCYGDVSVSDRAFQVLFAQGVEVAFLSHGGTRCRGRLVGSDPSAATLRMAQHAAFTRPECVLAWARQVVVAKSDSQLAAARHYQRHGVTFGGEVLERVRAARRAAEEATSLEQLRGVEGSAAAAWFALFGDLVKAPWTFPGRRRRPPTDPVNALLSLGYTWLLTRTSARCEALGLELYLGGLHEFRAGRPSLACDLIEPLRVPAVDRWVITLCNEGRMSPEDFLEKDGGIVLKPEVFGRTLLVWEEHWRSGPRTLMEEGVDRLMRQLREWLSEA